MEWIHYTLANRFRFHANAQSALDALTDEFGLVGVRPPSLTDGSTWEIEVSDHTPENLLFHEYRKTDGEIVVSRSHGGNNPGASTNEPAVELIGM